MSHTDQQSFYEIQLNTSHLLLVFLGAVVIGVTIFYMGVVIGGRDQGPSLPPDWQGAATTAADEEAPDDDAGTLPSAAGEEATGDAEDDAPVDVGVSATTTADDPGAMPPAREPVAAESATGDRGQEAAPSAPVTRSPAAGPPPGASAQATDNPPAGRELPEPDPGLARGWVVQVRSTTSQADAERLQEALVRDGYQAFVVSAEIDGATWYRVRVGRYADRDDATRVETALDRRSDVESTWITEG